MRRVTSSTHVQISQKACGVETGNKKRHHCCGGGGGGQAGEPPHPYTCCCEKQADGSSSSLYPGPPRLNTPAHLTNSYRKVHTHCWSSNPNSESRTLGLRGHTAGKGEHATVCRKISVCVHSAFPLKHTIDKLFATVLQRSTLCVRQDVKAAAIPIASQTWYLSCCSMHNPWAKQGPRLNPATPREQDGSHLFPSLT